MALQMSEWIENLRKIEIGPVRFKYFKTRPSQKPTPVTAKKQKLTMSSLLDFTLFVKF